MDLAVGAKRLWVVMDHSTKEGKSKLVRKCGYPLTAPACVKRVYTSLAVLDVVSEGFRVVGMVPGLSFEELQSRTDADLFPLA
jgi:3-oxoadipate CoA-transferase beta subunit